MKPLSATIKNGNRYETGKRRKGGSLRSPGLSRFLEHRKSRRALERHLDRHPRDRQAYHAWRRHFTAVTRKAETA